MHYGNLALAWLVYNGRKQLCRQGEEVPGELVRHWTARGGSVGRPPPRQSVVPSEQEEHVILQPDKLALRKTTRSIHE